MYYEEKIINGVLSFRHDPNGEWTPFTLEEMAKKWEKQKQDFEVKKQAAIRAEDLRHLVAQWRECLSFLPKGERIGYQECIEELEAVMAGDKGPIERW